jgi:hypothetical protein
MYHVHLCIRVNAHVHVCTCECMYHMCMCARVNAFVCTCACVCVYAFAPGPAYVLVRLHACVRSLTPWNGWLCTPLPFTKVLAPTVAPQR